MMTGSCEGEGGNGTPREEQEVLQRMRQEGAVPADLRTVQAQGEEDRQGHAPESPLEEREAAVSVLTEVIPMEGIDLEAGIPCELYRPIYRRCGLPAEFRFLTTCTCGDKRTCFACPRCVAEVTGNRAICGFCCQPRGMDGFC